MKTVKELYEELEDDNQHNLAAVLLAVIAGDEETVIKLAKIIERHHENGHLTIDDCRDRYTLTDGLYQTFQKEGIL